ncbi:MAG: lipid-A-disaccharide synthase [Pyrinomonadaceae bacterium]
MVSSPQLMIVAGEASGDVLGAELVSEIRAIAPSLSIFGTPGPQMRAAGVESLIDSDDWSVVGIGAVIRSIPKFLSIKKRLIAAANSRKPSVVILIDFPEFNLRIANELKKNGHCVIYYVSPQIWAWRKGRIKAIRNSVDLLLSILPFEKEWYSDEGIEHVTFVGNPISTRTVPTLSREAFCSKYQIESEQEIVALLPGSRKREIRRHLPVMLEAAKLLLQKDVSLQIVIAASAGNSMLVDQIVSKFRNDGDLSNLSISSLEGEAINVLNASTVAAVSSGTATLEAAVIGTPMVVVYKLPKLDYAIFKHMVQAPHIALVNLIAGKRLVNEFVQDGFTAETLADELFRLLEPAENAKMRTELTASTSHLRYGSPSQRAAQEILNFIKKKTGNGFGA